MIENVDYITEKPFYKYFFRFCMARKRLCIEIDGDQHQRFDKLILNNTEKDRLLKEDGWKELRLKWGYIVKYTQDAIKLITEKLLKMSEDALLIKLADMVYNSYDQPGEKALNRMYKNVCELLLKRELNDKCRELANLVILA